MRTRKILTALSSFVLPLALGLTCSAAFAAPSAQSDAMAQLQAAAAAAGEGALPLRDVQLFAEVLQRVREDYVGAVDEHKLMQAAIRGMVESLDNHSTFLSDDEFEDMQVTTSGAYAGIGVEVEAAKDGVSITRRVPGSPAERAGLHAGDTIVRIDDIAVDPGNVNAAIDRMRGADGSTIHLAVRRGGTPAVLQFAIRRAEVRLVSVEAERLTADIGYLRITSFTDSTAEELEDAVQELTRGAGHPLKAFVLDLRNNPGGVLDSAVRVADDFLDSGTIVSARGRTDEANFRVTATPGDITRGARVLVLVNGGSASAAEVLAAALHDNGRAMLAGRRTYGKGTVQTIMPMSYGTALKITTSRYFTPAGICINGIGIDPDVLFKGPEQLPADLDDPSAAPLASGEAATLITAIAQTQPIAVSTASASAISSTPALARVTLPERDVQVGMALSLLLGAHPPGVASSGVRHPRLIGRLDDGHAIR
jgi:carboxyl-terminal processing protease